jgi:hypothetical protein
MVSIGDTVKDMGAWVYKDGTRPAVVSPKPGYINIFFAGTDSKLAEIYTVDGGQSWNYYQLGDDMSTGPTAVSMNPNRVDVLFGGQRMPDGFELTHRWYISGSGWSDPSQQGVTIVSSPGVISLGDNHLDVSFFIPQGRLQHRYTGDGAHTWSQEDLGEVNSASDVSATVVGNPKRIYVFWKAFVLGPNLPKGPVVYKEWDGTVWSDVLAPSPPIETVFAPAVCPVLTPNGNMLVLFYVPEVNLVSYKLWDGNVWTGPYNAISPGLDAQFDRILASPAAAVMGPDKVDLAFQAYLLPPPRNNLVNGIGSVYSVENLEHKKKHRAHHKEKALD